MKKTHRRETRHYFGDARPALHKTIVSVIGTVSLRFSRQTAVFKMAANIFLSRAKEQKVHFAENYEILDFALV